MSENDALINALINAFYEVDPEDGNMLRGRVKIKGSQENIYNLYKEITRKVLEEKPKEISDLEYISRIAIHIAEDRRKEVKK